MKWDRTNRWLTLAANVGVLGGLLLVALQIRQNTTITRAQVTNDYYMADLQLELAMMGEDPAASWTKALYSPADLTPYDAAVLDRYFNYGLVQLNRLERMHELGLADDEWESRINYLGWHLGNEVGRRWWAAAQKGYSPEFVASVESILISAGGDANKDMLEPMLSSGGANQ